MSHLTDTAILLIRDGLDGAADEETVRHLGGCAECRAALEEARARSRRVREALGETDRSFDLEAARAVVRARIDGGPEAGASDAPGEVPVVPLRRRGPAPLGWSLGRAAAVLLVLAAGASALPWSPVRDWLDRSLASPEPAETPAASAEAAPVEERSGIRVDAGGGPLEVRITGVAPGTELSVRWVPGGEVAVFAPAGSRFASARGLVEVAATPGALAVELPRALPVASIRVDGRMVLRSTDAGVDLPGPVAERRDDRVLFRFPEP